MSGTRHKINFLSGFLSGFDSELSFSEIHCRTKVEEPCLPFYLPIAERRIIGFIFFPRVLALCKNQARDLYIANSLYIYIYILSSTDTLFRCITTHQCG